MSGIPICGIRLSAPVSDMVRRTVARAMAAIIKRIGRRPGAAKVLRPLRETAGGRRLARQLLGFHRFYQTVAEADVYASRYLDRSHTDPLNIDRHFVVERPRTSDYPVLFHMRPLLASGKVLFDLGGNVGNLFYCYRRYCELPPGFRWRVLDLPETMAVGRRFAIERGSANALEFADSFEELRAQTSCCCPAQRITSISRCPKCSVHSQTPRRTFYSTAPP
jgi:hypothetical protein